MLVRRAMVYTFKKNQILFVLKPCCEILTQINLTYNKTIQYKKPTDNSYTFYETTAHILLGFNWL